MVLTQVVPRERLVEAHAKNALAGSGAEVAGPRPCRALLIKALGAPVALLATATMLLVSVAHAARAWRVHEALRTRGPGAGFLEELEVGLRFVRGTPLLLAMGVTVGLWQFFAPRGGGGADPLTPRARWA
jgi:hypothetical protein